MDCDERHWNRAEVRTFGKYRLLELLASGDMAEVWRAELAGPGGFEKELALKLVRAELGSQPELARLFEQEARLASRLGHANVVQVFEPLHGVTHQRVDQADRGL